MKNKTLIIFEILLVISLALFVSAGAWDLEDYVFDGEIVKHNIYILNAT
jgi:hypothetical protein